MTISTVKAGTPSSFKVLWIERDFSGMFSQDCLEHDARVLRLSTLWELASRGNHIPANTRNIGGATAGYYILGDSAYPLQNWLLKPFIDT